MSGRRWTEKEIAYLENHIDSKTVAQIAKRLNRSFDSVNIKLNRMGFSGFEKSTDLLTMNTLCRMMHVERRTVLKKWRSKGLTIKRCGQYYTIRQENLIKYLKAHPEDWNAADITDDSLLRGYSWYQAKRRQDKPTRYHWTAEEVQRLEYLRRNGYYVPEIARMMERSESSIRYKLYSKKGERDNGIIRLENQGIQAAP